MLLITEDNYSFTPWPISTFQCYTLFEKLGMGLGRRPYGIIIIYSGTPL
jgi:hypothetical protein